MLAKSLVAVAGLALASVGGTTLPALAQTPTGPGPSASPRAVPPRIEVTPRPLLYRRCTSWYVIQHRQSGTVLFPEKHCWWVRG